ncbi:MAG: cytochrome c oxidase accessory protein CcoG [Pedobacter sp.]|nr:cytochrome c oxidase accessory protein CcoG [Pedobacter sp.]
MSDKPPPQTPPRQIPTRDQSPDPVIFNPGSVDLYAKREKIQARSISGFFQNIRIITIWATLAVYLLLPWVTWDGRQALLFDLPERKFYIFWWTFLPQDFFFLSWLLILAAFSLFALTVFAGRVYCGYICPQTVWTKIFMIIEHYTEGERNARLRMDKAGLSLEKVLRRGMKHLLWLAVAFITAITFVGYFTPAKTLTHELLHFSLGFWEFFWIAFFTLATYMNAGWMREQVCLFMCPYGRFQSVMIDRDSLIISYDKARGDPRGSRRKETDYKAQGLGDCIDCTLCVQVCPTGIDIRDGLQYECIQCAACIDACDSIMDQMGYARGLVRYTTENILENGGKYKLLRLRLIGYAAVISIMASVFLVALALRVPLEVETIRDRNQLYRETSAGMIENSYLLKIMNKSQKAESYSLRLEAVPEISMRAPATLDIGPGEMITVPVTLSADPGYLKQSKYDITFAVQSRQDEGVHKSSESRFLAPTSR